MLRHVATIALVGLAVACAPSGERSERADPAGFHSAVDSLLTESEYSWNGGDLDGFLYWYKRGAETSFMGAGGPALQTRPLAPWLGLATARYVLFEGDSITSQGIFTLVLERTTEGWRIIHDHSNETD
jgi:hypothetical protein